MSTIKYVPVDEPTVNPGTPAILLTASAPNGVVVPTPAFIPATEPSTTVPFEAGLILIFVEPDENIWGLPASDERRIALPEGI